VDVQVTLKLVVIEYMDFLPVLIIKFQNQITNRGGKVCTHCGRIGHIVEVCYRKHRFPPGHKFSNNKNNVVNSTVTDNGRVTEND